MTDWNPTADPGYAMYRCRLCGTLYRGPHHPENAVRVVLQVLHRSQRGDAMTVRPTDVHTCKPPHGPAIGIADFVGVRPEGPQ